MKKICVIGAPGSGKTTLAHSVFTTMKQKGINVELSHEWIRNDVQKSGAMESVWEQYRTRNHQKELEDAVPKSVEFLVSDAGTISMYFFAVHYFNPENTRERLVLQDMYRYLLDDIYLNRYDLIFYLPTQPNVDTDDGTRFQSTEDIEMLDMHMGMVFTALHKTDRIFRIDGPMDGRHDIVMKIIEEHFFQKDIAPETSDEYNDDIPKRTKKN
jgi:nicotinamide riboside kinase